MSQVRSETERGGVGVNETYPSTVTTTTNGAVKYAKPKRWKHVKSTINHLSGLFRKDEKLWEFCIIFQADNYEEADHLSDLALHRFSCPRPLGDE
jgi:hypothetical protein